MHIRRNRVLAFALLGIAVVAAGLWFWWLREPAVQMPPVILEEPVDGPSSTSRGVVSPMDKLPPLVDEPRDASDKALGFAPEEVLDNPECLQRPGKGPSSDVTVVVVPTETGGRFATVDASGILYSDDLPFQPGRFYVARRKDGSVLTVFDGAVREEAGMPEPEVPEPVRIYLDGQIIFDHHKIWSAEVADDGSSYSLIEPVAGGSRLVIRNLDHGTEHDYDLTGTYYRYRSGAVSHADLYSSDYSEVMLYPLLDGTGNHHFFPAIPDGRKRRMVHVPEGEGMVHTRFASSEVGYFSFHVPGMREEYFLARREFKWNKEGGEVENRWVREGGAIETISEDGSLLLMGTTLLDAATGETVFRMPRDDADAQLPRLRHILGPEATAEQVGQAQFATLVDDELWVNRTLPRGDDGRGPAEVLDVFKLDGIQMDSRPAFRVPANYLSECAPGDTAFRGLQAHEGRLTYLTTRR